MMDVQVFWDAVLRQDAIEMAKHLHPDAVIRWHASNEMFTVAEYIRANCEYPGDWTGEIERVECMGDVVVTAVRVWPRDCSASFHVVSFMQLREGRIAVLDEYWCDDGPAPAWRQKMHIGKPIREVTS